MLSAADPLIDDRFDAIRAREFSRLDDQGLAYLDHAASGLYGASQARAYAERLTAGVFGNPHSQHAPSLASERAIDAARIATLAFFDADPAIYDVCFTANTTGAIKLVAESYPFGPGRGLVLSADNHNSVNGVREFARAAGAPITVLPLTDELRLDEPAARLAALKGPGLLAYPQQSNFSGVEHPLDLIAAAQAQGFDVLVDAAGAVAPIRLSRHPADFVAFSFYKLFGLPTGVGALIARRDALARLRRPWFAGGTVDFVSIEHDRHQFTGGHAAFEDGTPNFLDAGAIETGFDFLQQVSRADLKSRLRALTGAFLDEARTLAHADGAPLVRTYGPAGCEDRGATVAFNVLRRDGGSMPYELVEARARTLGVAIRGGCFCNPGAAEKAFGFDRFDVPAHLDALGERFTVARFQERMGPEATVGALRLSLGLPTNWSDLSRVLDLAASFR